MKNFFKRVIDKKTEILLFVLIIGLGIFLRSYNFTRWLHFEVDQTYDYNIVSPALENGIGNLPLLGPTAGGGRSLRLGPAFYYMEYVSAKVFGDTPQGHAMNVLICSILALPLFYFLCRKFFSVPMSLGLLTIFSISFYSILYSRFSWSPNVLPFLMIFSFYAFLRSTEKNSKYPRIWFLLAVFLAAITTQIHFNAFFVMPAIIVGFLIYKRPKFGWKTWVAAMAIIIIIYLPVVFNEIATKGQDLNFFDRNIGDRMDSSVKSSQIGFLNAAWATIEYNANEYFLITSGVDRVNKENMDDYALDIDCHGDCLANISSVSADLITILIFFAGTILLIHSTIKEKETDKKDFLVLCLLWLFFSSVLYFFLIYSDYQMRPRFFLIVSPLVIIFSGIILEKIRQLKINKRIALSAIVIILAVLIYSNTTKISLAAMKLNNSSTDTKSVVFLKDVLPNSNRATMEQEMDIAGYIENMYQKNQAPIDLESPHEFEAAIWHFLEKDGVIYPGESRGKIVMKLDPTDNVMKENEIIPHDKNNFILLKTADELPIFLKEHPDNNFTEIKKFGTLTVIYIAPGGTADVYIKKESSLNTYTAEKDEIGKLVTWKKLFSHNVTGKNSSSTSRNSNAQN